VIPPPAFEGKETAIMVLVKCAPMTWKFHRRDLTNRVNFGEVCAVAVGPHKNARILLANPLQSSKRTFSWGHFLSFFAFQEGMWDTQVSTLLSSPTVSARYIDTRR
jgi:hypothetical protein